MGNMSFRLKFQYPVEDQSLSITWGGGRFWGASGSIESKGKGGISRGEITTGDCSLRGTNLICTSYGRENNIGFLEHTSPEKDTS